MLAQLSGSDCPSSLEMGSMGASTPKLKSGLYWPVSLVSPAKVPLARNETWVVLAMLAGRGERMSPSGGGLISVEIS